MTHRIHLSIIQPTGYVHSLGFLDQARFARHQFRQLGAEVTLGKNRLREDAINIIFGAHLGFPAQLKERFTCVFFNLEQLGQDGAIVSKAYIDLLSSSAVMDYDARNLAAYGCKEGDVPIVSFQFAPYLSRTAALPIEDRPIDLLFFGGINERRHAIFERIEACGWSVSRFDHPLFSEERDQFIRQSKAVFNCHFYESSRFEQARAFHTLSMGTPVISERTERTTPPPAFENAVSWISDDELEDFFTNQFMTPQWLHQAQQQLQSFRQTDAAESWQLTNVYCQALWNMDGKVKHDRTWRPTQINLGSGKDYQLGLLNIDVDELGLPDLVLDLSKATSFPVMARTLNGGHVVLQPNSIDFIHAYNALERFADLPCLMTNLLRLLKDQGRIELEINDEQKTIQHENLANPSFKISEIISDFTELFWKSGWFDHRLEIESIGRVEKTALKNIQNKSTAIKIILKKTETTLLEKTVARIMIVDFKYIPSDMNCS
jgi:SAM-dependent methyltransferase